jgi:GrpB-like predicted nucleotidyltransferase (UPF0157 family)
MKNLYNESIFFNSVNSAIKAYRGSGFKIIFVQHNNSQLKNGSSNWEIDNRIDKQVKDLVIQKKHGNAFQDTDLKATLQDFGIKSITVGGLVSHGCVKATCLGGLSEGFKGQAYHVHVRYRGDWDEIRFRDYLIKNKEVAKEYETLKLGLAEKYRNDREKYTNSKTEWIEKINKLTRKQSTTT